MRGYENYSGYYHLMTVEHREEGIVLRSMDYKEREKIVTIFTKQRGVISLIAKGVTKKKAHLLVLTSPFTQAEFHFQIKRSTLYAFQDATLLNSHFFIRKDLAHIQAASQMARALVSSQLPEKPAPSLYALLLAYLSALPQFPDPRALVGSFFLKILKYEGLLSLTKTCTQCPEKAKQLYRGESFCPAHAPPGATALSSKEWETLHVLTSARRFSSLSELTIENTLAQVVQECFKCSFTP